MLKYASGSQLGAASRLRRWRGPSVVLLPASRTTTIEDFERFERIFSTKGAEKRRQHGSKGAQVFRDPNDQGRVWVVFDWDAEGWQSFASDPEVPPIGPQSGPQRGCAPLDRRSGLPMSVLVGGAAVFSALTASAAPRGEARRWPGGQGWFRPFSRRGGAISARWAGTSSTRRAASSSKGAVPRV